MLHVQLRQFPHVARAFNLTAEELQTRLLEPWAAGRAVQFNDRRWDPERAHLTIYEAPELPVEQIGLGRGWANVTRTGTEVTEAVLNQARGGTPVAALKAALVAACRAHPVSLGDAAALAGEAEMRASERLAIAEQAVWELLHTGVVRLTHAGSPVGPDEWQAALVSWQSWRNPALAIELSPDRLTAGAPDQATTSAISRSRSASEANR